MASKVSKATPTTTSKGTPEITLWILKEDDSDDDDDSFGFLQHLNGDTDSDSSTSANQRLPSWQNRESQIDIKKLFPRLPDEERWVAEMREEGEDEPGIIDDGYDDTLSWTHNFSTFTGFPLPFTGNPGPSITSNDPYTIFTQIWDTEIMSLIVQETNRYARAVSELQYGHEIPDKHISVKWTDCTVDEMYVFFSLYIFISLHKAKIEHMIFGENNILIPVFPEIMSWERFEVLNQYLHFVDNAALTADKVLAKIKPVLEHCNKKFTVLYRPQQFLDIDDSLLLTKDGSAEGIRVQANDIGIRTYELSEVYTGYLLKVLQYSGSDAGMASKQKAEIVFNLVNEYSNKGHRVVTDRYFSSVYLARALRSKGFDSIGEVRKTRKDLPQIIQDLQEDETSPTLYKYKGNKVRMVSRHCGDLSVTAWSEFDVTALSTYHTGSMRPNKRGIRRPNLTLDYYKVKEKISDRDEDMSEAERMMVRPSERWYVKMFKRLLNISVRNSYIIYKCNTRNGSLKQIDFRYKLANQLLDHYGVREMVEKARLMSQQNSNDSDDDSSSWSDIDSDDSNDCSIM